VLLVQLPEPRPERGEVVEVLRLGQFRRDELVIDVARAREHQERARLFHAADAEHRQEAAWYGDPVPDDYRSEDQDRLVADVDHVASSGLPRLSSVKIGTPSPGSVSCARSKA
jgi:hypothetical protein